MRVPLAVLLLLLAAPVAAQDAPSLRAAMLGQRAGVWACGGVDVDCTEPTVSLPDTTLHDPWLGRDKALHAGGSFLLTLSGQYVLTAKLSASEGTALPIAAGTTLALGLAKEVMDSRRAVRPHFSTRDLVADAVGVALAVGLILL